MLAVFVFIKLQDKLQDIEIRFGNNVLQSEVCFAGMKKPSPVVGGRGLRGDCSLIRNRGICMVAGRSGEADESDVFAVGSPGLEKKPHSTSMAGGTVSRRAQRLDLLNQQELSGRPRRSLQSGSAIGMRPRLLLSANPYRRRHHGSYGSSRCDPLGL